jgi:hypothetical protein
MGGSGAVAAFDTGRQLIDLRLESHDLVAMVAVVHGGRREALPDESRKYQLKHCIYWAIHPFP